MNLCCNIGNENMDEVHSIFRHSLNIHPDSITLLPKGHWSTVYKVVAKSDIFAIKMQEGQVEGLEMEAKLMNLLRGLGIRTPIPLQVGYSIESDKSYLIMSYIEGKTLREVWKTLSRSRKMDLCEEFIKILSVIHSVVVDGCGHLSNKLRGEFSTLEEYTLSQLSSFAPFGQKVEVDNFSWGYFSDRILDKARKMNNRPIKLVHADFRMQNLIYNDTKGITVIDFGNALAMLPSFDFFRFIRVDKGLELLSNSEIDILEALYLKSNPLYEHEKTFVRAFLAMQLAPFSLRAGNVEAAQSFLHDLTGI